MSYPAQIGFVRSIQRFQPIQSKGRWLRIFSGNIVESGQTLAAGPEVAVVFGETLDHFRLAPSLDLEHSLLNMIYRKRENVA